MVTEKKINSDDIVKVVARLPESGARTVNNRHMPDVNIQYILASILVEGGLTFEAAHDYQRFQNPRVLALKEKVQLVGDEAMERSGKRFQGLVEVTLKDGRTLKNHVIDCRGRPENPMDPGEVEKKALWLLEPVVGKNNAASIIETSRRLETRENVRDLCDSMRVG
jgi:2-methylcitrate dehydratase PrpD